MIRNSARHPLQADREFHLTIAAASGNAAVQYVIETLWKIRNEVPAIREVHESICAVRRRSSPPLGTRRRREGVAPTRPVGGTASDAGTLQGLARVDDRRDRGTGARGTQEEDDGEPAAIPRQRRTQPFRVRNARPHQAPFRRPPEQLVGPVTDQFSDIG